MKERKRWFKRREPPNVWNNKFHFRRWFKEHVFGPGGLFKAILRVASAKQIISIIAAVLLACYGIAAIYNKSGDFNISIDHPMEEAGFLLSDTPDFDTSYVSLVGDPIEGITNININDIDPNVTKINGSHNGRNYIAYTFYLKNGSATDSQYQYEIKVRHSTKNTENAVWVMCFENDVMRLYAKANQNGSPECQYSSHEFPFIDAAFDQEYMQSTITNENRGNLTQDIIDYHKFSNLNGVYQLKTLPFVSDNVICRQTGIQIAQNEVHKFTVVVWIEGEDPECVNDILGGTIELALQFYYVKD